MPGTSQKDNRGPAAAADNRAALLASARRLFAEQGYHVALSAIARDSGVGQGSLYRHFPTKQDIAGAIFAENMAELEAAAVGPSNPVGQTAQVTDTRQGGGAVGQSDAVGHSLPFGDLWRRVVDQMVDSAGFVEVVFNSADPAQYSGLDQRLRALLSDPLARARDARLVDTSLALDDVLLVLRMIFGAIHVEGGSAERHRAARQALQLIGRGLALTDVDRSSTDLGIAEINTTQGK